MPAVATVTALIAAKAVRVIKDPRGLQQTLRLLRSCYRLLGSRQSCVFLYQRFARRAAANGARFTLTPRNARHALECRSGTSDAQVFSQIFLEGNYDALDGLEGAEFIVDCGANCGYSTAYFLTRCPNATVIAVEPDPENAAMLQRNVRPYGDRVTPVESAIWSQPASLVMSDVPYRDGRAWTKTVRVARPHEPNSIRAVDIGTLLRDSAHDRISILKIDIEGAEAVVFSSGYEAWLPRVDKILIELHDDSPFGDSRRIFNSAIAGEGFTISHRGGGELVVCSRDQAKPSAVAS